MYNIKKILNEKIYSNSFIIMFSKYYNFFNMFFYMKVDKLFFYRFNNYKISLMLNKKSNFNLIYNIF